MKKDKWILAAAAGAGVAGLAYALWPKKNIPNNAIVSPFDKERYMGKWHEIARLPNLIQKNLKDLTEEYIANADGSIKVITRAYNAEKNKPVEAHGELKFKGPHTRGKLGVAYYLPIYLDYNVLAVDEHYQHALVAGNSFKYLWILSRDGSITEEIKSHFLNKASELGFDTWKLEWF